MDSYKIIIAGGGTGGHLFPAIAIGEELKERIPNATIHFIGSDFGLEAKVFPVKDLLHTLLPIRGLQRGISFSSITKNFMLPFRIIASLIKLRKLFKDFAPEGTLLSQRKHTIEKGETISTIAQRYQINPNLLREYNELKGDLVYVGQTIVIPRDSGT